MSINTEQHLAVPPGVTFGAAGPYAIGESSVYARIQDLPDAIDVRFELGRLEFSMSFKEALDVKSTETAVGKLVGSAISEIQVEMTGDRRHVTRILVIGFVPSREATEALQLALGDLVKVTSHDGRPLPVPALATLDMISRMAPLLVADIRAKSGGAEQNK